MGGTDLIDERIAVPMATAVRVVDVSRQRLSRWSRLGLVSPQSYGRDLWEFDLANLVRGRMIRAIEDEGVHIRRIADRIRALLELTPDPLLNLVWAVDDAEIFTQFPDGGWTGGPGPGQGVMIDAIDPNVVRVEVLRALSRPRSDHGLVVRHRGVMGGKPIFAGTRISVSAVHSYLRLGHSDASIFEAYPDLRPDDLEEARKTLGR